MINIDKNLIGQYVKTSYENGEFQSIGIISDISNNFVKYHCLFQIRNGHNTFLEHTECIDRISAIRSCHDFEQQTVDKILKQKYKLVYNPETMNLVECSEAKINNFASKWEKLEKVKKEIANMWNNMSYDEQKQCLNKIGKTNIF